MSIEPPPLSPSTNNGTGIAPHIAAGLAEFFSLPGGLFFYFAEKNDPLVRFHSLQSIYLAATGIAVGLAVSAVTVIPFIGWLIGFFLIFLFPLFGLVFAVVWLMATIQAFNGKAWEIPWLGKLAKAHLAEGKFFLGKSPI